MEDTWRVSVLVAFITSGNNRACSAMQVDPPVKPLTTPLSPQERIQTDLQTERVGDGDHLGDARVHPDRGRARHAHGPHHTFHIRTVVSDIFISNMIKAEGNNGFTCIMRHGTLHTCTYKTVAKNVVYSVIWCT